MSSAYHHESQGALEGYHQTLKNMPRKHCLEHNKDWDKGVPILLFTMRELSQESLDLSLSNIVFTSVERLGVADGIYRRCYYGANCATNQWFWHARGLASVGNNVQFLSTPMPLPSYPSKQEPNQKSIIHMRLHG